MRSNLIFFVLVLVLVLVLEKRKFVRRLFDTHSRTRRRKTTKVVACRAVAQRAKAAHLTFFICYLYSDT
jgi:hypothetical protein